MLMTLPNAVFNKTQAATVLVGFYFTKSHKIGTSIPLPAPVSKGNTAAIQIKTWGVDERLFLPCKLIKESY